MKATLTSNLKEPGKGITRDTIINRLHTGEIRVSVNKGAVTISGSVESYFKKISIEAAVAAMRGVRSITNKLVVQPEAHGRMSDLELESAVINAITGHGGGDGLSLTIEKDWLMLEGIVDDKQGNKILVTGKVCKLEEKNKTEAAALQLNGNHKSEKEEIAYWQIFSETLSDSPVPPAVNRPR